MSDNNNLRKRVPNLVQNMTELHSIEEARDIMDALCGWRLCRVNKDGDIVWMKSPLIQIANGIRRSILGNGKSCLPTGINLEVLENDYKLVLASLSMLYRLSSLPLIILINSWKMSTHRKKKGDQHIEKKT
jgi:hypothetical protein